MKANNNHKNDTSKSTRLPIYLTHFGFFPMNKDGQVSNINAPINIDAMESEKKMILDNSPSNMNTVHKKDKNNNALKNLEKNKIPSNEYEEKMKRDKKISLTNEKQLSFNGPSSMKYNQANSHTNPKNNQINERSAKQNFLIKKTVPSRNNIKEPVMISDDGLSKGDQDKEASELIAQELGRQGNLNENMGSDNNIIRQRSNKNKMNTEERRRFKSQKQAANELFDEHSTDDNQGDLTAHKNENDRRMHQTFRIKKNKDRNMQLRKFEKGMDKDEDGHFVNNLDGIGLIDKKKRPEQNQRGRNELADEVYSVENEDLVFQKVNYMTNELNKRKFSYINTNS